jgi:hypothetical protein
MPGAQGEIWVGNQDDMRFPEGWDTEIAKLIPDASKAICIQARTDGSRNNLLSIPTIATRTLQRSIGMTSTEYESMFSDDEWSMKAWRMAEVIRTPLYFRHFHPANGTAAADAVYDIENRAEAYRMGLRTFEKRKALGFPRIPFPDESEGGFLTVRVPVASGPPAEYPLLALCIPGETFSGQWLDGFLAMGAELRDAGYLVKRYRSYHSNVYNTRIELCERVIEDAKISGDRPKYVLWIDSDNVAAPGRLTGLLRFLEHTPEVAGVAGWCWIKKTHGWTTSAGVFSEDTGVHLLNFNLDALFEGDTQEDKFSVKGIEHTGFPFFLMRYDAMEALGPYAFRPLTKADLPAFLDPGAHPVDVADYWFSGEDSSWCLHARRAGLKLAVDPGCEVLHLKLAPQQPTLGRISEDTAKELVVREVVLQGRPVEAPEAYERAS